MASKYFGTENPLGKTLILNNEHDYQVTGIFKEIPDNSHLIMVIGLFILLIACCNYMNLSTARSFHRAREVGLRKVVGASRCTLIYFRRGRSLCGDVESMFTLFF